MLLIIIAFIIISIFELRHLFKTNNRKEAAIYIVISGVSVGLAVFLMFVPEYKSFSRLLLGFME